MLLENGLMLANSDYGCGLLQLPFEQFFNYG